MKRVFDLLISMSVLVVIFPLLLLIAFLVRMNLGSPVLFRQKRPGMHGEPFVMIKFRTMKDLFDKNGEPLPDEKRMTPLGNFLRKSSLDELPELWNVCKCEMSLVGPRPLLMEYLPLYSDEQLRRHDVRPGITGWAQVNGRNAIDWEQRFTLDIWYVDHRDTLLDLKILWLTLLRVVSRRGISAQDHVTMPKFTGNHTARNIADGS